MRARIVEGLSGDSRLGETGLEIVDTRIVAIRPEAEVERALRAPARELIQQQADRAGFERRAEAVNRERAIAENELQNRIELATREEQLVAQQGANERRRAQEEADAAKIIAVGDAERVKIGAVVEAERMRIAAAALAEQTREIGEAEAVAIAARMQSYQGQDPRILLAIAAQSLAASLPNIGTLNLTPDVLTTLLSSLTAANGGAAS